MKNIIATTVLCLTLLMFGSSIAANAATRTVDRLADSETATACNNSVGNDCSLRGAISNAASGDTIDFDPTIFNVTRQISTSTFASYVVTQNITINGPGIDLLTVRQTFNVTNFVVAGGVTLNISGMSIACNPNGGSDGGGIFNNGTVNATNILVTQCNVSNNGGGIYNAGTLNLTNSSVSGNTASQDGGGIYNEAGRTATITNSTISGNRATNSLGGGVYNAGTLNADRTTFSGNFAVQSGAVFPGPISIINNSTISGNTAGIGGAAYIYSGNRLDTTNTTIANNATSGFGGGGINNQGLYQTRNTIITGNSNTSGSSDIGGTVTSFGYNLISNTTGGSVVSSGTGGQTLTGNLLNVPANLAPLGNYGGPTLTHALLPNSQAINAGDPNNSFATDQRGAARPRGGRGDIGSFEQNITISPTTLPNGFQAASYSQTLTATRLTSFAEILTPEKIDFLNSSLILAPFTYSVYPISGQSLPTGLTLSSGGVLSGTPTAAGNFTFTVQATDADGIAGFQTHTLTIVANTVPTISGATVARQAGSPVSSSTIATVNDTESGANGVTVTIASANPSNGVTISDIVNTNGTVTANVIAACGATNATFTLRAADTAGAASTSTLTVNVSANTAPTLTYPSPQVVSSGSFLNVSPTAATDNGTISYSILIVSPALTTAPTINSSGVVSITNAQPLGNHLITLRAIDNCGLTTDASFTLNVVPPVRTVTKTADTNDGICDADCSLREAFATASPNDTVEFASPLFDTAQTITLVFSQLYIDKNMTVNGKGASLLTINGNNASRVLAVINNANVTVNGLTVTGGRDFFNGISNRYGGGIFNAATLILNNSVVSGNNVTSGGDDNRFGGRGGGIYNDDNAAMTINDCTISGNTNTSAQNSFAYGGGIYNANATLIIKGSTISGNSSSSNIPNFGGGIFNGGTLIMTDSTVSGNSLANAGNKQGGGIYNSGTATLVNNTITLNSISSGGTFSDGGGIYQIGTMRAVNNIVSGNTSANNPDLRGGFNTNTNNYLGGNAMLAPLAFNGGATRTHALLTGSPAINAGSNCVLTANGCGINNEALTTDQRGAGYGRLSGAAVDIGAIEAGSTLNPPTISGATVSRQAGSTVSNSQVATVNDVESGANGVGVTITSANPSNGVTVSGIVNTNGTVTANIVAVCGATNANFTLTATDGSGATATATLTVTVTANTAPTLIYPASFNVNSGDSIDLTPTTATDNGSVSYSIFSVSPVLTTAPTVNSSGVVSITNANPIGNHTITVRATDVCNLTTNTSFTLNVEPPIRTVTKTDDTNDGVCDADCSLREAIAVAVSGDTIQFATPLFNSAQTITLASELNVSGKTITILGKGANLTAVSGNNQSRVFNVGGGSNLTLDSLTVTNGRNFDTGGGIYNGASLTIINSTVSNSSVSGGNDNFGGGIYNGSQATLIIRRSTISGNSISGSGNFANRGGGIANVNGSLTITNSTVSGNSLGGGTNNRGGGIYSEYGPLTIINDTITANIIAIGGFNYGGGVASSPDGAYFVNSIVSNNFATGNPDILGSYNPNSNFIGGDAGLAPLGFYGGTTQTHALLPNSPVLNSGNNCVLTANGCANGNPALTTDQRGGGRIIGEIVDIGAFESSITFDQTTLPNGNTLQAYNQQLSASRQAGFAEAGLFTEISNILPTDFAIVPTAGQSLPPGITLANNGLLSGLPTMAGNYVFTVKATDTDGIAGVRQYEMMIFAPTAANVSISGRISNTNGSGISRVLVTISDVNGNTRTALTGTLGNYRFENVQAGATYLVSVSSKRYRFNLDSQVLTINDDAVNVDFIAQE